MSYSDTFHALLFGHFSCTVIKSPRVALKIVPKIFQIFQGNTRGTSHDFALVILIVNFEHISRLVLVFLLLTLSR